MLILTYMYVHIYLYSHVNLCRIDSGFIIKVADFGLAEGLGSKEYFRQSEEQVVKLPLRWLALESINDKIFSEKSDVVRI